MGLISAGFILLLIRPGVPGLRHLNKYYGDAHHEGTKVTKKHEEGQENISV
jgi:hypothetical protein